MDNNDYYQTIIVKINHLITEEKLSQAFDIVKEELQVAYIPQQYQDQLQKLHDEIVFNLNQEKNDSDVVTNF